MVSGELCNENVLCTQVVEAVHVEGSMSTATEVKEPEIKSRSGWGARKCRLHRSKSQPGPCLQTLCSSQGASNVAGALLLL